METCPCWPPFAVHGGGRTVPVPIMATMSATDAAPLPHSPVSGGNAFFPKRKFYGQANRARITCNTYSVPYKGKDPKKTPFSKIGEYTDTSVCYIPYFPYFPVPQPVEKCIQSQLIQTEYTARIGEYKTLFGHTSVTIGPACIRSDPKRPHRRQGRCYTPKP